MYDNSAECVDEDDKMNIDSDGHYSSQSNMLSSSESLKCSKKYPYDFERSKINQVELRIQNDLMEIKKNKMSTKMFETQLSDITKDEINQIFTMNILIKENSRCKIDEGTYSDTSELAYQFLIIFDRDYPFNPPFIKLIGTDNGRNLSSQLDQHGNLNLKFLTRENWSPILSLNSILFAIELLILDPEDSTSNINSLELYRREEIFAMAKKTSSNFFVKSNSPKILKNDEFTENKQNRSRKALHFQQKKNVKRKFGDFQKDTMEYKGYNSPNMSDNNLINFQVKRFKQLSLEK